MTRSIARTAAIAAALAAVSVAPHAARAEGPATMHGLVYSCNDQVPIASARVTLLGVDDGTVRHITTDAAGRFVRVGLMPGRYLVVASTERLRAVPGSVASRMALLDTDDNLDLRIGTYTNRAPNGSYEASTTRGVRDPYTQATPACDAPLVPLAHSTASRYIIR